MALKDITKLTNAQLWNMCRAKDKNFANVTAEATADTFTEKGFYALTNEDINVLGDFYKLSIRIGFQALEGAKVHDPFEDTGLVEVYNTLQGGGGMVQRIYLKNIDPLDPQFKNWDKYDVKSPYMDLGAVPEEQAFWSQNFDFQSGLTLAEYDLKRYFLNERGMGIFLANYMAALDNCFKKQKAVMVKEMINGVINNDQYPLQETQVYSVNGFDMNNATTAQVVNFIRTAKNVKTAVKSVIQSGAYNAANYETYWDIDSDSVCICRAGLRTELQSIAKLNAPEFGTDIPFDNIIELNDFGGIEFWVPEAETRQTIETGLTDDVATLAGNDIAVTLGTGCTAIVRFSVLSGSAYKMAVELTGDNAMAYRVEKANIAMGDNDNVVTLTRIDGTHFEYDNNGSGFSGTRVLKDLRIVHGIQVYQAYDQMGSVIPGKYSLAKGGEIEPSISDADVTRVDVNADVLCVVLQKGALFADMQNSYQVRTQGLNSRTLRQTFWASLPNGLVGYDHHRGAIVITK